MSNLRRNIGSTLMQRIAVFIILMMIMVSIINPQIMGQKNSPDEQEKLKRADQAAALFIRRFRETLDFGVVFDEMAVSDAALRLQRAEVSLLLGVDESLIDKIDSQTTLRLYKAFMNFYYLRAAYVGSIEGTCMNEDRAPVPPEIRETIQESPHLRFLVDKNVDAPGIKTVQELDQYISDFERVARLYKEHLRSYVFDSAVYKTNVKALNRERGVPLEIRQGYEKFGVQKEIEVYVVKRDIFTIYFVEEDSKLKVLTVGIGE